MRNQGRSPVAPQSQSLRQPSHKPTGSPPNLCLISNAPTARAKQRVFIKRTAAHRTKRPARYTHPRRYARADGGTLIYFHLVVG